MAKQLIPHITPQMLRDMPDQVAKTINELIDEVNQLDK